MRRIPLFLSAILFAAAPALAVDAPKSPAPATTPAAPAAATTPAPTPAATPAATAAPAAPTAAPATPASSFSDAQRTEIENIIKDYLVNKNPTVLMEAMQNLQKRQLADADVKSKEAIGSNHEKLYSDPTSPIGGNPKGSVTVVEFFDYQCGYCKMSEPNVQKLLKDDKDVKFIYKDFPILGPVSTVAAKAAMASVKQGKYQQFHDALMSQKGHITEDDIYKIAKDSGLDVDKLKKDMNEPDVTTIVEANVSLGTEVGARGTPTFIIADHVYPGALDSSQLKKAVDEARAASKKP